MTTPPIALLACMLFLIGAAEVVAGPMMKEMAADLGVAAPTVAWLPSLYALTYALCAPLLGPWSDRLGRRTLLLPGLGGLGLANMVVAATSSMPAAACASALAGLCAAAVQPNALAIVADHARPQDQARQFGQVFAGLMFSFVLTPLLAAGMAAHGSWRLAYAALGLMAWTAALASVRRLPSTPRPAVHAARPYWASLGQALRRDGVAPRLGVSFLWLGLSAGIFAVLGEVLRRQFSLDTAHLGWALGLLGLATVAGSHLVAPVTRMLGNTSRTVWLAVPISMAGTLTLGLISGQWLPALLALLALWAFLYGAAGPCHHTDLTHAAGDLTGTVTSVHASLLNLGIAFVSGWTALSLASQGPTLTMGLLAAVMALAWWLQPRQPPQARQAPR